MKFPRTHGLSGTTEHTAWKSMRARCYNPNYIEYQHYGGRGIRIFERWFKFENFIADMGMKPTPKHTLDRYPDRDGNYEPGNCRWATMKEQQNNRRNNFLITAFGESLTAAIWSERLGIQAGTLLFRIKSGWNPERALLEPCGTVSGRFDPTIIIFNGAPGTIREWSEQTGIPIYAIQKRLAAGWSVEKTLTAPKGTSFGGRRVAADMATIRAIADGTISLTYLNAKGEPKDLVEINEPLLNFLAKQRQADLGIPGCSSEESVSFARSRR